MESQLNYNSGVTSQMGFEVPPMNNLLAQDAATPLADSTTRLIPLTQGKFTIVDAADFERLSKRKWQAHHDKRCNKWYAETRGPRAEGHKFIAMHRVIMDAPEGILVDHADMDGLNNRRSNLRLASKSQNAVNSGKRKDNTSGYRGVYWHKTVNKWAADIMVRGSKTRIGFYATKEAASEAYQRVARESFGEFVRT